MRDYLKRLVTTGAAYQFGDILAKGLALITLPLYTRHVDPKSYGAAESLLTAVILASIVLRAGVGEAFIRFYFDDEDEERRDRMTRTAIAAVVWTTTVASLVAVACAGPPLETAARLRRSGADRLRDPGTVGVHEPGDGLRPAARRRTHAHVRVRVGRERRDDGHVHGRARRVRRPGGARAAARQLRRLGAGRARAVGGAAQALLAARESPRPEGDAELRPADGAGGRERVRAAGRRPLLPAALLQRQLGGAVRGRAEARDGRVRGGARLPVRVAAAGLLDRERRGGGASCTRS